MGRSAKLKAVRRAAEAAAGNAPKGQLVIAGGKLNKNSALPTAVHAKGTLRDVYKRLKKLAGLSPEVAQQIEAQAAYRKMIAEEAKRGGPLFDRGEKDGS